MPTTLTGAAYRLTFLTSRLVRLEYQKDGHFEDRLTTCARYRDFPPVHVETCRGAHGLEADTEHLHIVYDEDAFSASGLSISVKGGLTIFHSTWRYGEPAHTLGGTFRTLDEADGAIPVEEGLVSRFGFSLLDDSSSMLLDDEGRFSPREREETDIYFFGYGHDYEACLRDYYKLSGAVPMLPRYALGNWWSRYYEYTEESYLELMNRFEREDIPLSVAVIDMDWHLTHVPYGSGWTGYTWNKELFPAPDRFLGELHKRGMRVTLNLHPAGGVEAHEEAYSAMCKELGRDPEKKLCVDFDAADETFLRAYFKCLHHPLEKDGVDFWWIDWQQGAVSAVKGLDPLWVLNVRHYLDTARNGQRSLILSRYAGPGSHRYPIGFSGDTIISWESLDFQPRFTAMAANIGYPWWSHDIGGHMKGERSDELAVRWLQFGVFSPIMRLHSSKNEFCSKEPWAYGLEAQTVMSDFLRLRHRLIPYLYTAAWRSHTEAKALVRPVYHRWSEQDEAYQVPNQYLFGDELMVCPITTPMNPALRLASFTAWLPKGRWYDMLNGQIYNGDRMIKLWRPLEEYPVLAPAGALVPLADSLRADENPAEITLMVFGGADGSTQLYEDDGISVHSASALTTILLDWENGVLAWQTEGDSSVLPENRKWNVRCVGFAETDVFADGKPLETSYDKAHHALCFTVETGAGKPAPTVTFASTKPAVDDWLSRVQDRLQKAQTDNREKEIIWALLNAKGRSTSVMGTLRVICRTPELADCLEELLFAQYEGENAL